MKIRALAILSVLGMVPTGTSTEPIPTPKGGPASMLTGGSVPMHLETTCADAAAQRGWRIFSAAHGNCPVSGETVTNTMGKPRHPHAHCASTVSSSQNAILRWHDPDVVVWWDRWSLDNF